MVPFSMTLSDRDADVHSIPVYSMLNMPVTVQDRDIKATMDDLTRALLIAVISNDLERP